MIETVYRLNGEVINIGAWDTSVSEVPDGAVESQEEILTDADGGRYVATDYLKLRRKNKPSVEEQIEALWEGGQAEADMKALLASIDAQYPKPV